MNRKKILITLSILFFLSLSSLVAWYIFFFRCQKLPDKYSFFEKYITQNTCTSTSISLKGTMFNIRKEGENLKFDINAWDTTTKKTETLKDIYIPYDDNTKTQLSDVSYLAPVELTLKLEKKYKYILIQEESSSEEWNLKKITYTKADYLQYLRDLFYVLTFNALDIEGQTFPYSVLSSVEILVNGEENIATIGENNLASLYRMYVLLSGTKNKEIDYENLHSDFTVNSYMDALTNFLSNNLKIENKEQTEPEDNDGTLLLKSGYFGGCTLTKRIINDFEISEIEKEKLIKEYCNIGRVGDILTNVKKLNFRYTNNDLLGSINTERFQQSQYGEPEILNMFLPSDLLATADLVSSDNNKKNDIYNLSSLFLINSILQEENSINLYNFCSYLSSNYFSKELFSQDEIINNNTYRILLDQDITKMTEYMSDDIQAGLLCIFPESTDKYVEEFNNSILAKYLTVDWFNSSEEKDHALWDGSIYRIIDNSRLYEILLRHYENLK